MKGIKKTIVALVTLLCVMAFVQLNTYHLTSYIEEEGYALPTKDIQKLLNNQKLQSSEDVRLVKVSYQEPIYKNARGYFAGEDKKGIDIEYPMIVQNGKGMRFLSEGAYMINDDFDVLSTYEGMYLSGGYSFNADERRADTEHFVLVQTKDGLYMNPATITVETFLKSYTLSVNAITNFNEEYINSYLYEDGSLRFQAIRGLQNANIVINGKKMTYSEFLKKLEGVKKAVEEQKEEENKKKKEIKEEAEEQKEKAVEEAKKQQENQGNKTDKPKKEEVKDPSQTEPGKDDNTTTGDTPNEGTPPEPDEPGDVVDTPTDPIPPVEDPEHPGEGNPGEGGGEGEGEGEGGDDEEPDEPTYTKPSVSCNELKTWVYTTHTDLTIKDPSKRIIRSVRFNIYDEDGKLLMRKQYREDAKAELSILPPDTTSLIEGVYQYYGENGEKLDETFLAPTAVHTLPIEGNVAPIKVSWKPNEFLYSTKMQLNEIKMDNDSAYDETDTTLENFYLNTLPYVSKGSFHYENKAGNNAESDFSVDQVKKLTKKETIQYTGAGVLASNSAYDWNLTFYDRYGNALPTTPKQLQESVKTAKQIPTAKLRAEENKAGKFKVITSVSDADKAIKEEHMTFSILDAQGRPLALKYETGSGLKGEDTSIPLSSKNAEDSITVTNLPFGQSLKMQIKTNYDIVDGHGMAKDAVIAESEFYSASLVSGALNYTNSFSDVLGTSAVIDLELNQKSTTALVDLMSEFSYTITSNGNADITYTISKELMNQVDMEKAYDEKNGVLLIQEENRETKQPEITMEVSKKVLEQEGMTPWQAFLNGAFYGTGKDMGGILHIKLAENTLAPSTKYTFSMKSSANQAGIVYDLQNIINKTTFTTKKREPQIRYDDYFVAQDFIEFYNMNVEDVDGTVIDGNYAIQLLKNDTVIKSVSMKTNTITDTLRFDGLDKHADYKLRFVAAQYNDGQTVGSMMQDHIFYEYIFKMTDGIEADLSLENMEYKYTDEEFTNGNIDPDTVELNKSFEDGKIVDKEGWFVTDYLPAETGTTYFARNFANGTFTVCYYNKQKVLVGYELRNGENDIHLRNTSSNLGYVKISGIMDNLYQAQLVKFDSKKIIPFEYDHLLENKVVHSGNGNEEYSTTWASTPYIPVEQGQIVAWNTLTKSMSAAYFDENKNFIGGVTEKKYQLDTIPARASYIRLSLNLYTEESIGEYEFGIIENTTWNDYQANVKWTLLDHGDFLKEKDTYQLNRYVSDDLDTISYTKDKEDTYTISFKDGKMIPEQKERRDDIKEDKHYKYEMTMQYHGKTVVLDTVEFDTDKRVIILRTAADLIKVKMEPSGYFIAENDIKESGNERINVGIFSGTLDFQGHVLHQEGIGKTFEEVTSLGVIKNIVLERSYSSTNTSCSFVHNTFLGRLENIIYRPNIQDTNGILPATLINTNYGTIQNFVIELNGNMILQHAFSGWDIGILATNNYGIIQNGYLYNKVENAHVYVNGSRSNTNMKGGGVLNFTNFASGAIKNVFVLSDVYGVKSASASGITTNGGQVENAFLIGDRYQYSIDNGTPFDEGLDNELEPSFGEKGTSNTVLYSNVYSINKNGTYKKSFTKKAKIASLNDPNWYYKIFQNEKVFTIDENVPLGFYPRIQMTTCMMNQQPYVKLPEKQQVVQPTLVDADVKKQTEEYAEVMFRFKNPNNAIITDMNLMDLDCQLYEQQKVGDFYEVKARLTNPKSYVSSYRVKTFKYQVNGMILQTSSDVNVEAEFFDEIKSFEDWQRMKNNASQNYRLKTDLDFSTVSNWNSIFIQTMTGKLDGGIYDDDGNRIGFHSLKNITPPENWGVSSLLMSTLSGGSISNLYIENCDFSVPKATQSASIFFNVTRSKIDQVHLRNIHITGGNRTATLSGLVEDSTIVTNTTAKNISLNLKEGVVGDYLVGGFFAQGSSRISNSYIDGLSIDTGNAAAGGGTGRVGGFAGQAASIDNSYVAGSIKADGNVGGFEGNKSQKSIHNCWSNVKINIENDYAGGITLGNSMTVKNTLSLGDIMVTSSGYQNVHRIAGDKAKFDYNNYGHEEQLLNAMKFDKDDTDGIFSTEELMKKETYTNKIKLGDAFDYSKVQQGVLPQLYATTGEALPDQDNIYLKSDDLKLEVLSAKQQGNKCLVELQVTSPGFKLDKIQIDGMTIIKQEEYAMDDKTTTYKLTLNKEKAIDLYKLNVRLISISDTGRFEELNSILNFGAPIYWEIHNVEEWQSIMKDHGVEGENFKIMGEIDFTGVKDPAMEIIANRIVGVEKDIAVICNLISEDTDNITVIRKTNALENITFDHITIQSTDNSNRSKGIIGEVNGSVKNLVFSNDTVKYTSQNSSKKGMIGYCKGNMENIRLGKIRVIDNAAETAHSRATGGLIGAVEGHLHSIEAESVVVNAPYIEQAGGVAGFQQKVYAGYEKNRTISLKDIDVRGKTNVGGFIGTMTANLSSLNVKANSIKVNASGSYCGGLIGNVGSVDNEGLEGYSLENFEVNGLDYVGGVTGSAGGSRYIQAKNFKITAQQRYAGGIAGFGSSLRCQIENSEINAKYGAGGISGLGDISSSNVLNSTITAERFAGGLIGTAVNLTEDGEISSANNASQFNVSNGGITSTKVIATDHHAGGLVGTANVHWYTNFLGGYVIDSEIFSENGYAGGIVGESGTFITESLRLQLVRNTKITSNGNYVGGVAGKLSILNTSTNPIYKLHYQAGGYIFADIKGKNHVGGIFGDVEATEDIIEKRGIKFTQGFIINSNITATDGTPALFADGWQDVFDWASRGGVGLKTLSTTTLNGRVVDETDIHDDGTGKIEKLIGWDALTDSSLFYTTQVSGGLNWHKQFMIVHSTIIDYGDMVVTLIPDETPTVQINCANLNGEYTVKISNSIIQNSKVNFEDGKAILKCPAAENMKRDAIYSFQIYNAANELIGSTSTRFDFSNSYIPVMNGEYFYDASDITPTITLPEGKYQWYRSNSNYSYKTNYWETILSTSNRLTVTSRGYYYAQNVETGEWTPRITVNTIGYMPFFADANEIFPCQAGFTGDVPTFENAVDITDRMYRGGYKLPYVPYKFSEAAMKESTSTTKMKTAVANDENDKQTTKLPDVKIYASQADSVNVELSESLTDLKKQTDLKLTVTKDGKDTTYTVDRKVFTFGFDYQHDLTVTLSNGKQKKAYVIEAEKLRKSIATYGMNYAYLNGTAWYVNQEKQNDTAIHLYGNQALLENGSVMKDGKVISTVNQGALLETRSLTTFTNGGEQVQSFKGFSQVQDQERPMRLVQKSGYLYALDANLETTGEGVIADSYQQERYLTIVSEEGRLLHLMQPIHVPEDFMNEKISELSADSENATVLIRYENGGLEAFNYLNGERISLAAKEIEEKPEGFLRYAARSFMSMFDAPVISYDKVYEDALELQEELLELDPKDEELLNGVTEEMIQGNTKDVKQGGGSSPSQVGGSSPIKSGTNYKPSQPYVAVFDPVQERYELYRSDEVLDGTRVESVSENEKLEVLKEAGHDLELKALERKSEATREDNQMGVMFIFVAILAAISGLLGVLYRRRRVTNRG